MREIKFRAWNRFKKEWVKFLDKDGFAGIGKLAPVGDDKHYLFLETDPNQDYSWNQYTGLKDKNGKEIYEGDICRDNEGHEYKIFFGLFGWTVEYRIWDRDSEYATTQDDLEDVPYYEFTIIGNIYENPELKDGG